MSQAISPSSKRPFGLARVCRAWGVSRASLYRRRMAENPLRVVGKRGPKTQVSDEELLALIREDLATTEWAGEGHRKVWARLRALKGVRTSRPRVLRLMREAGLLAPTRARHTLGPRTHEGTIIPEQPNPGNRVALLNQTRQSVNRSTIGVDRRSVGALAYLVTEGSFGLTND
jgi:putative transposase